ncbi:MAG: GIY-YIG nuclease family protein [Candidatus Acidiferrales bacterium]
MYYTYVLVSERDRGFYIGCTANLKARLSEHNRGRVASSAARKPFRILYYEACLSREDAFRREKYLKTGRGRKYLRNRIRTTLYTLWPSELERAT